MIITFAEIFVAVMLVNIFLIATMILLERKKPESVAAWIIVLTFLPIIGFLIYALIGGGLSLKTKRMLKKKAVYNDVYIDDLEVQANEIENKNSTLFNENTKEYKDIVLLNMRNAESIYTKDNDIELFVDGKQKFKALKKDIMLAKNHIHLLYFIFANDATGQELCKLLTKKAKAGVKVKLLYDSFGSLRTKPKMFSDLIEAGGKVLEFFPPLFGFKLVNFKANYRNHRKIVVIDGKVGYTGGLNIRDDHMGRLKRLSPWRDAHMKILGSAVHSLQNIFLADWIYASKSANILDPSKRAILFPELLPAGNVGIQIVASGPETKQQQIKDCLIKMINSAKTSIYIQTPYFVPDEAFMEALKLALLSGVEVNVMIPSKPDKQFVFYATLSHIKVILELGAKIYLYEGFLHAKTLTVDEKIATVGTCNMDIRSFMLNFEVNSVIYSSKYAKILNNIYIKDVENSSEMGYNYFRRLSRMKKFLISIFRLFSPIL